VHVKAARYFLRATQHIRDHCVWLHVERAVCGIVGRFDDT
jgi:hypothetical protein